MDFTNHQNGKNNICFFKDFVTGPETNDLDLKEDNIPKLASQSKSFSVVLRLRWEYDSQNVTTMVADKEILRKVRSIISQAKAGVDNNLAKVYREKIAPLFATHRLSISSTDSLSRTTLFLVPNSKRISRKRD